VIAELKRLGAEELHPIHCSGEYAKTLARSSVAAGSVLVYGE
jgi:metal-dependent hydrolase (beta-lactamase superfamily II)